MSAKSIKHQITVRYNGIIYNKVYCEWYYGNGGDIITDANLIAELELARRICNNIIPTGTFTGGGSGGNQDLQSVTDIGNTTTNTIVHAPAINDDESATLGQVKSNVEEEATLRISNDAVLNNKIETETQDRITADNTLTSSITEESDARQLADEALDAKLQEFMTKSDNEDAIIRIRLDDIEEQLPVVGEGAIHTNPGSTIVSLAIDPSDNVLSQTVSGLKSNIVMRKDSDLQYTLVGNNGANLGTINLVEGQAIKSVDYNPTTKILTFVFATASGDTTVEVDMSEMVVTYTGSQYINIDSGNVISLNYAALKSTLDAVYAPINHTHSYNNLTDKPTIPAAQVNSDWNATGTVAEILNKPILSAVATSGNYLDLINKPVIPAAQIQSDWNQTSTTDVDYIKNKPVLAKVATTGSYNDLLNKPTITAPVNADWNSTSGLSQILNKPTLSAVAISGSYNDLINRPSYLPNQYSLNIQLNGNAQPSYNGSAERTINITPASIGAATVASLEDYVKKSGDTMTGKLTTPTLTLSDTTGNVALQFSRVGVNYVQMPVGGIIRFYAGSTTTAPLNISETLVNCISQSASLGNNANRWNGVYSVTGDFSTSIRVSSLTLSTNYISGANSIGIVPSGLSVSAANAPLMVNANTGYGVYPGTNNKWSSGIATQRWSNVYSVLGNFSGVLTSPVVNLNTASNPKSGIAWYSESNAQYQTYLASGGTTGNGINGNLTAPRGQFTTGWSLRNVVNGGAVSTGWTWESLAASSTTPTIVAELNSIGNFRTAGTITAPTFIGALQGNADSATYVNMAVRSNANVLESAWGLLPYYYSTPTNYPLSGGGLGFKFQRQAGNNLTSSQVVVDFNTSSSPTTDMYWRKSVGNGTEMVYGTWKRLLDDSNFDTIIGGNYVKKSGDTMTGNLTAPIFIGALTGNASTATTLQTARTIGLSGVTATAQSFNGSANITIPITAVPATLLTGTASINTTGNAATATTLQTTRTIFGQNFNGSANVTGALTGVTNITASGTITASKVQVSSSPTANTDVVNKQYGDTTYQPKLTGVTDIQVVSALPSNPIPTVLYLIPAS